MRSLKFTSHHCFFNPSRVSPEQVDIDKRKRIIVPGKGEQTAVFLTPGVVASCHLVRGHDISGRPGDTPVRWKDIGIWCYQQEFELMSSFFASVYKVNRLCGPIMGSSFVVSTRKEGAQGANQWADSSKQCLFYFVFCCWLSNKPLSKWLHLVQNYWHHQGKGQKLQLHRWNPCLLLWKVLGIRGSLNLRMMVCFNGSFFKNYVDDAYFQFLFTMHPISSLRLNLWSKLKHYHAIVREKMTSVNGRLWPLGSRWGNMRWSRGCVLIGQLWLLISYLFCIMEWWMKLPLMPHQILSL